MNKYIAGLDITVHDPWANCQQVEAEYGLPCLKDLPADKKYSAVILAVCHDVFVEYDYKTLLTDTGVLYDVKGILDRSIVDGRL